MSVISVKIAALTAVVVAAAGAAQMVHDWPSSLSFNSESSITSKKQTKRKEWAGTYAHELAFLDQQIAASHRQLDTRPNSWMTYEQLASRHRLRARLTGSYEDYSKAEDALGKAFEIPGAVPYLTRATLHFSLHRLSQAEADILQAEKQLVMQNSLRSSLVGLRADVALQRGDYDAAWVGIKKSLELHRSIQGLSRLANYYWKVGEFELALGALDDAEKLYQGDSPAEPAWFDLQRGLIALDRGRYDEALVHYQNADHHLSGWWLIGEHIAEIKTLQGKTDDALADYLKLIEETGSPEFMDAAAGIYASKGNTMQSAHWVAQASAVYNERLHRFPEASFGHALDHFLDYEQDSARVLELAKQNVNLRPGGEAQVKLASALIKAGDLHEAQKVLEQTLHSAYRSAKLYAVAAETFAALGNAARSTELKSQALAINPRIL